jgi:hypothetical protein
LRVVTDRMERRGQRLRATLQDVGPRGARLGLLPATAQVQELRAEKHGADELCATFVWAGEVQDAQVAVTLSRALVSVELLD